MSNNNLTFLQNLKKQVYCELNVPDPKELFDKENELMQLEKSIKEKVQQLSLLEKELIFKENELNDKIIHLNNKEKQLISFETIHLDKQKQIMSNNLLPKVMEKKNLLYELTNYSGLIIPSGIKNLIIDIIREIIDNNDEYIIHNGLNLSERPYHDYGYGGIVIITNKGKMFYNSISSTNNQCSYMNFNICQMNDKILQALLKLTIPMTLCNKRGLYLKLTQFDLLCEKEKFPIGFLEYSK